MTLQDFETGLVAFAETYMLPHLDNGFAKWLFYLGLGENGIRFDQYVKAQLPLLTTIGIVDADGGINLDDLEKNGKAAFKKQPRFKLWKFTLSEQDFDALMAHLRGGRQVQLPAN